MKSKFSQTQIDNLNVKLAEAVINFEVLSAPRKLNWILDAMNALEDTGSFEVRGFFSTTRNPITISVSQL